MVPGLVVEAWAGVQWWAWTVWGNALTPWWLTCSRALPYVNVCRLPHLVLEQRTLRSCSLVLDVRRKFSQPQCM